MTAVELNTQYSRRLGWFPGDFGAQWYDTQLVQAIATIQTQLGITVDGIAGPKTYSAVLQQKYATLLSPGPCVTLAELGQAALCTAKILWLMNIIDGKAPDKHSRDLITEMICSSRGLGWTWEPDYVGDGDFEWCLAFGARVWASAGLRLIARKYGIASTYRIDRWARYMEILGHLPDPRPGAGRLIIQLDENSKAKDAVMPDGSLPRAGDFVLLGGVNTGPGKHGAIAESFDVASGVFTTIEGNAWGLAPSGAERQGVVRCTRRVGLSQGAKPSTYFVRRVIRPALVDCVDVS